MTPDITDSAIVYCQGNFNTPNGKTAHGLVRFTRRYNVLSVIDANYAGQDAGQVLDNKLAGIPVVKNLEDALAAARKAGKTATHFVVGLAPDGGRLSKTARQDVHAAITAGLNIDSGLHDFLSEDTAMVALAEKHKVTIRDIRRPPERKDLHFFSGEINEVNALKVAVLGTDSAVGKRTTAWLLVHALRALGHKTEMIGTGQTAWMQGATFTLLLDSIINDFLTGEIEHQVVRAWRESKPEVIVVEGQGSLLNPAYPGGYEIIAAARPDVIVLQHAPARKDYDGFPGYPIQPLPYQIDALEIIAGKPVAAITINHEDMDPKTLDVFVKAIGNSIGRPAYDVLVEGAEGLARHIATYIKK